MYTFVKNHSIAVAKFLPYLFATRLLTANCYTKRKKVYLIFIFVFCTLFSSIPFGTGKVRTILYALLQYRGRRSSYMYMTMYTYVLGHFVPVE